MSMATCLGNRMDINKVEERAEILYTVYCDAVGGKAFNGDPLPTWEQFAADMKKTKQADAWREVAAVASKFAN